MDPKDLKTLLLLEALDKKENQSQRELSKRLNISLGLVNTFIKKLISRGIFEVNRLPRKRVQYHLTGKGLLKKVELTKQYLSHSLNHYKDMKRRISDTIVELTNDGKQNIVLYGVEEIIEIACIVISQARMANAMIIDDKKAGETICGFKINAESILRTTEYDIVIIADVFNNSSSKKLIEKGVPTEKIVTVFPLGKTDDLVQL
jgi:predicted transcriptional regulator